MQTLHQGQCFKTHHSDAAASRLRLNLRLDDVWVRGCTVCKGECVFVSTQHSALPSTAAFNKKVTFHYPSCILFSRSILTWITVLHLSYGQNPLWMSSSVNMFCSMKSKVCGSNDMPAQEYHCMSWLCQNDLLYRFYFLFSEYTHAAVQAKRALEKSHEMLALKPKARFLKTIRDWDWNWSLFQ